MPHALCPITWTAEKVTQANALKLCNKNTIKPDEKPSNPRNQDWRLGKIPPVRDGICLLRSNQSDYLLVFEDNPGKTLKFFTFRYAVVLSG
jgi:hypothetical protein